MSLLQTTKFEQQQSERIEAAEKVFAITLAECQRRADKRLHEERTQLQVSFGTV